MSDNAEQFSEGTLIGGKFRVMRLLGAGGVGAVYQVEHELTRHVRALKLLHPEMRKHPSIVTRFLREASAAGHIGNPHIVETFDAGELPSGEPYLVMEYLEGEMLSDSLKRRGPLPITEIADLIGQACAGVQAAHERGIVHRDLKPDNIFIVERDGRPFVKLLDFGISKFNPELTGGMGITQEGGMLGTPFYMPPEQVRGETNLDARADIYALGVILYECASGRRPFEADSLTHLALLIYEAQCEPIESIRPDVPPGFGDIIRIAMAKDREQRFQSARLLADALVPYGSRSLDRTMPLAEPIVVVRSSAPPRSNVRSSTPPRSLGPQVPVSFAPTRGSLGTGVPTSFGAASPMSVSPGSAPTLPVSVAASVPVGTEAGTAISVVREGSPSPRALIGLAVGVVAAAAIAVGVWKLATPARDDASLSASSSSVRPPAPALSAMPSTVLGARPEPSAVPPLPEAPGPQVGAAPPVRAPAAVNEDAGRKAGSKPPTRVDQHGLADDNPFR